MIRKWLDERFRPYFIFGESADGQTVTISDGERDIVTCAREEAERLIADRQVVIDALWQAIEAHGDRGYEVFTGIVDAKNGE